MPNRSCMLAVSSPTISTPTTGRRSRRLRPRPSQASPDSHMMDTRGSGMTTSTPNHQSGNPGRLRPRILSTFDMPEEEEEEENIMPCTQFRPGIDGEVFYNLEASPRVKQKLAKHLEGLDKKDREKESKEAVEEKQKVEDISNKIQLRQRTKKEPPDEDKDEGTEAKEAMASMRQACMEFRHVDEDAEAEQEKEKKRTRMAKAREAALNRRRLKKIEEEKKRRKSRMTPVVPARVPQSKPAPVVLMQQVQKEPDPFEGSDDDSFLLKCSQAVDRCGAAVEGVKNNSPVSKKEDKMADEDPFEDADDSFDIILSQMDTKPRAISPVSTRKCKQNAKQSLESKSNFKFKRRDDAGVVDVKAENSLTGVSESDLLDSSFKRFHSAGCCPNAGSPSTSCASQCSAVPTTSTAIPSMSPMSRIHSNPTVPGSRLGGPPTLPGGRILRKHGTGVIRCSQQEIERKRMEAIRKRKESQMKKAARNK